MDAQRSNLPQISPKWKIISASCAKVALHGKNCTVVRKHKSYALQHRNFLVGLLSPFKLSHTHV